MALDTVAVETFALRAISRISIGLVAIWLCRKHLIMRQGGWRALAGRIRKRFPPSGVDDECRSPLGAHHPRSAGSLEFDPGGSRSQGHDVGATRGFQRRYRTIRRSILCLCRL